MTWLLRSAILEHAGNPHAVAVQNRSGQVVHLWGVCYNAPQRRDRKRAAVLRRNLSFGRDPRYHGVEDGS
jgi:hypothetical protein